MPLSARKKNIPIILYNGSIGPIDRPAGGRALRKVLENSPLVITRDSRTRELLDRLQINHPEVVIHADCALNTEIPAAGRLEEIIRKEGLFANPHGTIGLNVNAYIDDFNQQGKMNRQDFCKIIAETADRLIDTLNVDILFTVSQIMDMAITRECVNLSRHGQRIRIVGNCDYTYQELAGLLSKVDIHAGLRTHTLIFCAAVNTPMVNINAYPKSAGFINTIGMGDYTITFEQLNTESLTKLILQCWENRSQLRARMKPIVDEEKRKARASVNLVSSILDRL
ncbi:MAG TPA: polysaccharide pyruvyl transferase family protein [Desulforhopalus sp.]|nr:polysaccharide pyruvyl transferase family protein [Desulforhopalus sp.]